MSTMTEMRIEDLVKKLLTNLTKISDYQMQLANNTAYTAQALKEILITLNQLKNKIQ